jgi:hypothetical protein
MENNVKPRNLSCLKKINLKFVLVRIIEFLAYFPKVDLRDLLPVCVCVSSVAARQRGLLFDKRRDWPFSVSALTEQSSRPSPRPSQTVTENCRSELLPDTVGETKREHLVIVIVTLLLAVYRQSHLAPSSLRITTTIFFD